MKKLVLSFILGCLFVMSASAVKFTNNVKYKVILDGWWPDGPVQLSDSADGSAWQSGHIIQTQPVTSFTNLPVGVTMDRVVGVELAMPRVLIVVTADEIDAAAGVNLTKKAINAIKAKVKELGGILDQQLQ